MKNPATLKKPTLAAIVRSIQNCLYRDVDGNINPDKEWNADTIDEIRDILGSSGLLPGPEDTKRKLFAVHVHDRRDVKYLVEAEDAAEARRKVEASDNADEEFGGKAMDTEWCVTDVEEQP